MPSAATTNPKGTVSCVIVAAGRGRRFGAKANKILLDLGGHPLLLRTLEQLAHARAIDQFVVVVHPDDRATIEALLAPERARLPEVVVVLGGAERVDSVARGVAAADPNAALILVHDAARPFVPAALVQRLLAAASEHGAAVPVVPVADTLKRVKDGRVTATVDRTELGAAQTPQAFRADVLRRALEAHAGAAATDDAALVESLGLPVAAVSGDPVNFKVTRPADLVLATAVFPKFDRDHGSNPAP